MITMVGWRPSITTQKGKKIDNNFKCTAKIYESGKILLDCYFTETIKYDQQEGVYMDLGNIRASDSYGSVDFDSFSKNNIKYVDVDIGRYWGCYNFLQFSEGVYKDVYWVLYYFYDRDKDVTGEEFEELAAQDDFDYESYYYKDIYGGDKFTLLIVPDEPLNGEFAQVEVFGKTISFNSSGMLGDVNNDSRVNASDAASMLIFAAQQGAGQPVDVNFNATVGDVDLASGVNAADATHVLMYAAVAGAGEVTCTFQEWMETKWGRVYNT